MSVPKGSLEGMLVLIATVLPKEVIVELLSDQIEEFKELNLLGKTEELDSQFHKIAATCALVLQKASGRDAADTLQQFDKIEKALKLLDPEKQ